MSGSRLFDDVLSFGLWRKSANPKSMTSQGFRVQGFITVSVAELISPQKVQTFSDTGIILSHKVSSVLIQLPGGTSGCLKCLRAPLFDKRLWDLRVASSEDLSCV